MFFSNFESSDKHALSAPQDPAPPTILQEQSGSSSRID
jgi:hypothetical protein